LALVGHYENFLGIQDYHFLTFNVPALYAGIPMIVIISSFLAIPALIKLHSNLSFKDKTVVLKNKDNAVKYNWFSNLRGTMIGSFFGFIPMIGTMISSNVSWSVEKLFHKDVSINQSSINRLISAESANNSANITVLIPLLVFGLAIVPSEILLLSILETQAWSPGKNNFVYFGLNFYHWVIIGIISVCIVSYTLCYILVLPISKFLVKNIDKLTWITMFIIIASIGYSGWNVDNFLFFLLTFFIFTCIILLVKNTEFMPLVVGFLTGNELLNSVWVVTKLYF
jgi:TctA family transporter